MPQYNGRSMIAPTDSIAHFPCDNVGAVTDRPKEKGEIVMDFYKVPIGFGMALAQNTAAMNRYAHLTEAQKQDILNKAHNVRSEKEMYSLVANLANGQVQ